MNAEYEIEPIRGLPAPLPSGERLLWQGEPQWWPLAQRAFHVRALALYFVVLLAARWFFIGSADDGIANLALSFLWPIAAALAALGLLLLFAWLIARTTIYTITSRRIVMRFGVALPVVVNIPFRWIEAAGVKCYADGTGDIPLGLRATERIAYLLMWPHARPWRITHTEPMLRGVRHAEVAAKILARALAAESGAEPVPGPIHASEAPAAARVAA